MLRKHHEAELPMPAPDGDDPQQSLDKPGAGDESGSHTPPPVTPRSFRAAVAAATGAGSALLRGQGDAEDKQALLGPRGEPPASAESLGVNGERAAEERVALLSAAAGGGSSGARAGGWGGGLSREDATAAASPSGAGAARQHHYDGHVARGASDVGAGRGGCGGLGGGGDDGGGGHPPPRVRSVRWEDEQQLSQQRAQGLAWDSDDTRMGLQLSRRPGGSGGGPPSPAVGSSSIALASTSSCQALDTAAKGLTGGTGGVDERVRACELGDVPTGCSTPARVSYGGHGASGTENGIFGRGSWEEHAASASGEGGQRCSSSSGLLTTDPPTASSTGTAHAGGSSSNPAAPPLGKLILQPRLLQPGLPRASVDGRRSYGCALDCLGQDHVDPLARRGDRNTTATSSSSSSSNAAGSGGAARSSRGNGGGNGANGWAAVEQGRGDGGTSGGGEAADGHTAVELPPLEGARLASSRSRGGVQLLT